MATQKMNVIANNMSRLENADGNYDHSQLIDDHPSFNNCCQFQPSPILLGMISGVLLNNASPDLLMIKKLKPQDLSLFISQVLYTFTANMIRV